MDAAGTCFPVTLYNLKAGYGVVVGDTVAIPEPFLQSTDFIENKQVSYLFVLEICEYIYILFFDPLKFSFHNFTVCLYIQ